MIIKKYSDDFYSSGGALTLNHDEVTTDNHWEGYHKRTHDDGWTIEGEILSDYSRWINDFLAIHPVFGKVWGNFERRVYADSEEGFQDFYTKHIPYEWDYSDD